MYHQMLEFRKNELLSKGNHIQSLIYLSQNLTLTPRQIPFFTDAIKQKILIRDITGYFFESKGLFLLYFEGSKKEIDHLIEEEQANSCHRTLHWSTQSILKRRYESWNTDFSLKITGVEKMFLQILVEKNLKAAKLRKSFFGFVLRFFHDLHIWKISAQMHLVTQSHNMAVAI